MTVGAVLTLFVWIVAICALAWLAYWVIQQFSPPEPIVRIATIAIVVIAVVLIIALLLQATGVGFGTRVGAPVSWFVPSATDLLPKAIPLPAELVMDRA